MTDGFKASLLAPKKTAVKLTKLALQDAARARFGRAPKLVKARRRARRGRADDRADRARLRVDHAAGLGLGRTPISARAGLGDPRYGRARRRAASRARSSSASATDSLVDVKASDKVAQRRAAGRGRALSDRALRHLHGRDGGEPRSPAGRVPRPPPEHDDVSTRECGPVAQRVHWRAHSRSDSGRVARTNVAARPADGHRRRGRRPRVELPAPRSTWPTGACSSYWSSVRVDPRTATRPLAASPSPPV